MQGTTLLMKYYLYYDVWWKNSYLSIRCYEIDALNQSRILIEDCFFIESTVIWRSFDVPYGIKENYR